MRSYGVGATLAGGVGLGVGTGVCLGGVVTGRVTGGVARGFGLGVGVARGVVTLRGREFCILAAETRLEPITEIKVQQSAERQFQSSFLQFAHPFPPPIHARPSLTCSPVTC